MTLFEWVAGRWRKAAPEPESRPAAPPTPGLKAHVPAEYAPLYTYLHDRYASTVVLTFAQMESLLGFALPGAARTERNWWTDTAARTARHADAWTLAHRTAMPNLPARTVVFERQP